jgi:ketosteroid isomerase-like protein
MVDQLAQVRRLYNECWLKGQYDLVPELLDPGIVWTAIESAPDHGTRRGHAECVGYMEDWTEDFQLKPHSFEVAASTDDGLLVCAQHARATGKGSGVTTEIHYACVHRFASDGRIAEIHEYATLDEALASAGLAP